MIAGPTAVGKTNAAISLAQHLNAEIVSFDSRQFYKELNMGVAKPTPKQLTTVPHHFINTLSVADRYNAAQFGDEARSLLDRLFKTGRYVVACGGSGLYLKGMLEGFDNMPEIPAAVRGEIMEGFETNGVEWLHERLRQMDPEQLAGIDTSNPRRLARALEVRIATGRSLRSFQAGNRLSLPFRVMKVGLEIDRSELYRRIDRRVDAMMEEGLLDEVRSLLRWRETVPLQTVGYQELFRHLDGQYDLDEAVRLIKRNTRRYAKRQLTWFRRDPEIRWVHPEDAGEISSWVGG